MTEYRSLVLDLLSKRQYPVLLDQVIVEIYFKLIPVDASPPIRHYDGRVHARPPPLSSSDSDEDPYRVSYLVDTGKHVQVHRLDDDVDTSKWFTDCRPVRVCRSYVDNVRNVTSATFEEELYHFLALLNYDLPTLAPVLGFDAVTCTRLLPQFLRTWVVGRYTVGNLDPSPCDPSVVPYFGPPSTSDSVLPVRVLEGRLAPCTSTRDVLSLDDRYAAGLDSYLWHYAPAHRALLPLAYNPLENPVIVAV